MIGKFRLQNMSVWSRLAFSSGLLIVLLLALAAYAGLEMRGHQNHFFLFAAVILVLGVASASLITRSITRQLGGELTEAAALARDIATGNFQNVYKERKRDDDSLMGSLLKMREGLRGRRQHLYEAVQHLADSSGQLSASSKSLEATLNEQAASTNEVVASARQISATSQELLRTMGEVADLSSDSAQAASDGQTALSKMTSTMQQIESASGEIAQKLAAINARVGNITGVVTTIHKVADQTNLLSLNASIEAAKAGEYGQGFSVVAREIRRLADQTGVATLEIEQIVHEMQSSVVAGVMGMEKFAHQVKLAVEDTQKAYGQISSIIQQVQSLQPRFESVNEGMESQSAGARQISEAMLQLSEATKNTAESQHASARAIDLVQHTAQALESELNKSRAELENKARAAAGS